jgi:hypothetical protein
MKYVKKKSSKTPLLEVNQYKAGARAEATA